MFLKHKKLKHSSYVKSLKLLSIELFYCAYFSTSLSAASFTVLEHAPPLLVQMKPEQLYRSKHVYRTRSSFLEQQLTIAIAHCENTEGSSFNGR